MIKKHNDFNTVMSGTKITHAEKQQYCNTTDFVTNQHISQQAVVLVELIGLRPSSQDYHDKKIEFENELRKYKYNPLAFEAHFTRMRHKIIFGDE